MVDSLKRSSLHHFWAHLRTGVVLLVDRGWPRPLDADISLRAYPRTVSLTHGESHKIQP